VNLESVNIFANPISGRGKGKTIAARLEKRLRADGYAVTTSFERPTNLPPDAINDTTRAVIIIGGDGTIRAVAERLVTLRGESPPLLPVPLGTANLMVSHLGFKWNDETLEDGISEAIRSLPIRTLDVASANGSLFLLMAGIGFDALVVHELDRIRKGPIHMLSYLKPTALALRDYNFPAIRVTVDGTVIWRSAPAVAFVGNIREYGVGFSVLPFAKPDDGLLDVCVMPCANWFELAQWFLQAAAGQHVWSDKIKYLNGKHILIESKQEVPVQIDGDSAGHTPLEITLLPRRVPFIVP
jgi:YegS/Rv2252/BmrU family lipid kinase